MKGYCAVFLFLLSFVAAESNAQHKQSAAAFKIIPLGVRGGSDESNLSSYMLAVNGTNDYICLDAGTLNFGIEKAVQSGIFRATSPVILKNYIKGYLISHPHLDHVAGLIINSPDDTVKNIYGLPFCLNTLRDNYFTWKSWANFANEGEKPTLKKYTYTYLSKDTETALANTKMLVKAFPLSHSNPYQSTAFLIRSDSNYILYLGDTGADSIEKANNLRLLWQQVTPLVVGGKLKGIFIEVSFPDQQNYKQLFGHLTPTLLMQEMQNLAAVTDKRFMKGLNVIITHIKPAGGHGAQIKEQLVKLNKLHLHLIFAEQAHELNL